MNYVLKVMRESIERLKDDLEELDRSIDEAKEEVFRLEATREVITIQADQLRDAIVAAEEAGEPEAQS